MLILASGGEEVHQAITSGSITPTEAVHVIRKHGDDAPKEIERLKEVAAESGKVKITGAVRKNAANPKKVWPTSLIAASRAISKNLGDALFGSIIKGECPENIEVRSDFLAELLMALAEIPEDEEPVSPDASKMDMLEDAE